MTLIAMKMNSYTRVALRAAEAGSAVLRRFFRKSVRVGFKGAIDPVTEADRASQEAVRRLIRKEFPDHSLLAEEDTTPAACAEYCWIVDPLDGTVNFIHNIPVFAVSVALMHRGKIVSGVVHAPLLKEIFVAEQGSGAWCNGKKIAVSGTGRLLRSLVVTGFPYYIRTRPGRALENLVRVTRRVQGIRRLGSAALDLAYVAAGRFEAFWEEGLSPWDVAAGALLVQEAGGSVTDFSNGNDYILGKTLLASNGIVHRKILKLIHKEKLR